MKPTWGNPWRLAPIVLSVAVAGCSSLLRSNAPPVQVYSLTAPPASSDPAEAAAAPAGSLRVAHPLAGPGLGTAQIVLRQPDYRMNVYAASTWAADAPSLVESLAVQTMRASGRWSSVQDAESPFPAKYLLQISIRRFDADYGPDGGSPPTIHVTLDCTLGAAEGRKVLASFVASGSATAGANRLGEVVAAFQQAADQALASMSQQSSAAVGAAPRSPSGARGR